MKEYGIFTKLRLLSTYNFSFSNLIVNKTIDKRVLLLAPTKASKV